MSIGYLANDAAKGWGADLPTSLEVRFVPAGGVGARVGESPFWDRGDFVWWVDIAGRRLLRTQLSTRTTRSWPTPETPGFVVLTGPGRPAVGMERGIYAFSQADGRFKRLVAFEGGGRRFNDATVDDAGRLWASTMAMDAAPGHGALHLVTTGLALRTVLDGLTIPNGLAADMPAGRLFVSDSHPDVQSIWTAPCDFGTGEVGVRSEFASMRGLAGRPDGAAFTAGSGHYWIAGVDGAALHGFSREGLHEFTVPLPFSAPTKPAFLAAGIAVTAKAEGGYGGQLAVAMDTPPTLRGAAVAFWRPGGGANEAR